MEKTLNQMWSEFMNEFRSNSIKTLDNGAGEYQICFGSPHNPEVILTRSRKNCRSDAVRDDWECRKIREGQPTSQWFKLAQTKLDRLKELDGQVWYRMKPNKALDKKLYEGLIMQYFRDHPGYTDGQKVMKFIGMEEFGNYPGPQGMEGNRIMRRLVSEGVLKRAKITYNLDESRSGKIPCWGYALADSSEEDTEKKYLYEVA